MRYVLFGGLLLRLISGPYAQEPAIWPALEHCLYLHRLLEISSPYLFVSYSQLPFIGDN